MGHDLQRFRSRRAFLAYLAGSPLFASLGLAGWARQIERFGQEQPGVLPGGAAAARPGLQELGEWAGRQISSAEDAIDVFDFQEAARRVLPPAHYGYLATGVDGDATLRANREGFAKLYIRPRRLVDVTTVDTATELLGARWETPIVLAPAGSQRAFHPEGELGTARAARTQNHLQVLSTVSSTSVEEVAEARGAPVWYQLYPTSRREVTRSLLRRAEAAGSPVVVLTVDLPVGSNRLTLRRYVASDTRDCSSCHAEDPDQDLANKPMFAGTGFTGSEFYAPGLTWEFVRFLRDETMMKIVIKGVVTHEDAELAVEHGIDGIVVSNHGGRAEDSGRATIGSLPEVVEAVAGRIPVLVDSGFRRGTDIFKALALGASAVCIGRPYLWGLAAFGQAGVEKVLQMLRAELEVTMQLAGTPSLADIGRGSVGRA